MSWLLACLLPSALLLDAQSGLSQNTKEAISPKALARFKVDFERLVNQNKLPGVAAGIIKNQKLIWAQGIGYADIENKVPTSPTTLYRLASTSKPFAAVLIMQLVEQGKLSLDTPMATFRVPSRYSQKPILVRHVLSHTSEGTPGQAYRYSGDAYSDLTLVIEETVKESYPNILKMNIFDPTGMDRTLPGLLANTSQLSGPYRLYQGNVMTSPYATLFFGQLRIQRRRVVGILLCPQKVQEQVVI